MALKLDLSKAYDRVEWVYLETIMKKMGFGVKWINLIMECISTVTYSVLINGEPTQTIQPSRGLRQGDSLSPYLFLLCSEGLHCLLHRERSLDLLDCYERASSQQLNRNKTSLFFSKSTPPDILDQIKNSLEVQEIKKYEKYLGLPSLVGRKKKASLLFIKERVAAKLQGWKEQLLSQAGREPKSLEGMGFKELQKFNEAMLSKQEGNDSFAWKSILKGRDVISKGVQWRVGNCTLIQIYHDNWLLDPYNKRMVSPRNFLGNDAQESVLIDNEHRCWLREAIDNIFLPHEAVAIKSIPLSLRVCEEKLFWPHSPNGKYPVKSAYRVLMEEELKETPSPSDLTPTKRIWKGIWSLRVPNRVKTLLCKAGTDSLPSKANLMKQRVANDDLCSGCKLKSETSFHALWSCTEISPVWEAHFAWLIKLSKDCNSLVEVIQLCQERSNLLELFATTVSLIWARRNQLRVGETTTPLWKINSMAIDNLQEL
ncbi:uncharacterized protein LOC142632603 [Castanea sativa]|uniref:uncharacterized protein LOC142632603 n=1 Tax=Castanea sativa TaxID=21020 RepID=UPI003F64AC42